jgi:hypothetical protein
MLSHIFPADAVEIQSALLRFTVVAINAILIYDREQRRAYRECVTRAERLCGETKTGY